MYTLCLADIHTDMQKHVLFLETFAKYMSCERSNSNKQTDVRTEMRACARYTEKYFLDRAAPL